MNVSPQSQAVLDKLLGGETLAAADVEIGPLDESAVALLRVVTDRYEDLRGRAGTDQVQALRRLHVAALAKTADARPGDPGAGGEGSPVGVQEDATLTGPHAAIARPQWRLVGLRCQSIRGIAPAGESFAFSFEAKSTLIFGPNGSGKSSLLSAIAWVLTGRTTTDAEEGADNAPLYSIPKASGRVSKIRDWPVIHTLPGTGNPRDASPSCWAHIEMQSPDGNRLHLRRSNPGGLESSCDGVRWTPCPTLAAFGIQPLDLQLSLIAPTVFGRRSIESAADTRHLLSLMLGFDDLEGIGELASNMGRNRTILAKGERDKIDGQWADLGQILAVLPGRLRGDIPVRAVVERLATLSQPSLQDVREVGVAVASAIDAAEAELAALLGLTPAGGQTSGALADALTIAVVLLEKDLWTNFESLGALRVKNALPAAGDDAPTARLSALRDALEVFISSAKTRITKRYAWWQKETLPGSKSALLIHAAQYHDPEGALCPVCDQAIGDLPIQAELAALKAMDQELLRQVKQFFRDLEEELGAIVPADFLALGRSGPGERLLADWEELCEAIGTELTPVVARADVPVRAIVANLAPITCDPVDILPPGAEPAFAASAAGLAATLHLAKSAIATLSWADAHLSPVEAALRAAITTSPSEGGSSLRAALSLGKQAAADILPLNGARDDLRSAHKLRAAIGAMEDDLRHLEAMKGGLDSLKGMAKYAAHQVGRIFDAIKVQTMAHCQTLYPEAPCGLSPVRLVMGTGRDKTVEAYLSGGGFEVPGQHFANAGLQRAVTLSFFFALLEQHPGGLGFVVMDDPILSLDDDHRESWSTNILKPKLDTVQVILATHQRQYLNNCKHDFQNGRLVELNPRSQAGGISWRPGDRLDRAAEEVGRAWTNTPNELRKYREELLVTLDAYSPVPFLDPRNLTQSLARYTAFAEPHPLAGAGQRRIVAKLTDAKVERVLDPGSHAMTESDVTQPMVTDCLKELHECDGIFRSELQRLDRVRAHERRRSAVPPPPPGTAGSPPILPFKGVCREATWDEPIELQVLGPVDVPISWE